MASFLKSQLVQGRARYSAEHEALSIESEEELLSVYMPREIKEWLPKKGEEPVRVCRILQQKF